MSAKRLDTSDPLDRQISWSIYMLAVVIFGLLGAGVATSDVLPIYSVGDAWFWTALALGGATALVINRTRPKYEKAGGRWRSFYDFLLRQMRPPD